MSTLLLRLDGPMQAWGTASRFGTRDTGREPSKSGVIGLLCAALGKPRVEDPNDRDAHGEPLPSLSDLAALVLAVRVDREGVVMPDYHTVGGTHGKDAGADVVSTRFYLADACFLVGLAARDGHPEDDALLTRIDRALTRPVWQLCLGRKAFPPAAPVRLRDGLLDAGLAAAVKSYSWLPELRAGSGVRPSRERRPDRLRLVQDAGGAAGTVGSDPSVLESVRQDVPVSFDPAARRFTIRRVATTHVDMPAPRAAIPVSAGSSLTPSEA